MRRRTENTSTWKVNLFRLSTRLVKCHMDHFCFVLIAEFQLAKYYVWSKWTKQQPEMANHRITCCRNWSFSEACSVSYVFHSLTSSAREIAPNPMPSLKMLK